MIINLLRISFVNVDKYNAASNALNSSTEPVLQQFLKHFRFIVNLCVPMVEVVLLAVIDNLRNNENKVKRMVPEEEETKLWERASFWIVVAKMGLPLAYMLVTLAIVMPGLINIVIGG